MNDLELNKQDPKCTINEEYLSKTYDESEILNINIFKNNITSFIFNFDTENYELNNEKNDVINISKNIFLSNEEEQLILDECSVSNSISYNIIEEETEYLSTYEK